MNDKWTTPSLPRSSGLTPRGRSLRRPRKVSQLVASEIVREIVEGGMQAGQRLPTEAELVDRFAVGRASVREALRVLEGYGLVTIRQGKNGGPVVEEVRPEDLSTSLGFYFNVSGATYGELIDARLLIEPAMARLAAERQSPAHLLQLKEVVESEQSAGLEDAEYVPAADAFHFVVSGMSGNVALDLIGRSLRTLYQDHVVFRRPILGLEQRPRNREFHQEIADAIFAHDGDRAERLMASHLRELSDTLEESLPTIHADRIVWDA